jgi:simple sugar transport system ATP-binding protein
VEAPVAFIPEDRTTEGLLPDLTLTQNLVLSQGRRAGWVHGFWLDWRSAERRTAELIVEFGVVASGPGAPAASLSGGNQQKFVVAAALERRPAVVLAENPTRGLDLKAAAAVHERLRSAAAAGAAVVLYSSDFDEVLVLADRVVVLAQGVVIEPPAGSSRAEIGRLMLQALASGTAA